MKALVKLSTIVLLFFCVVILHATNVDSLSLIYSNEELGESERLNAGLEIAKSIKKKSDLISHYRELLALAKDLSNDKNLAFVQWKLGKAFYDTKSYDSARVHYKPALVYYSDQDDHVSTASLIRNDGLVDFKTGLYAESLEKFQSALVIEEKIDNPAGLAATLNVIGSVHRNLKQYDDALIYYKKCEALAEEKNLMMPLADAMGNQGIVYRLIDSIEQSIKYFDKTLQLSKQHKLMGRIAVCLNNMGILYEKKGDVVLADKYLKEADAFYTKMGRQSSSQVQSALGRVSNLKGDYQKAFEYCDRALQMALKSKNEKDIRSAYPCLIRATEKMRDYKSSLNYMQEFDVLKDSLFKESNVKQITEMELEHQFAQEQQVQLLEQEKKDNMQRQLRNGLLIGLLGLGIISLLLYRMSKVRKQNNEVLEEKNNIITKALNEKDILLKEIHHRVKNNLQLVSSLLTLQSREVKDSKALEAITEGQSRVRSMALIHQDLYTQDNLKGIGLKNYVENLARELFSAYKINDDNVKLELDIQDINLDVDSIIPLGLIINELMTNALKYAFTKKKEGTLRVSIKEQDQILTLDVQDDGVGFDGSAFEKDSSYGNKLVSGLTEQLEGELKVDGTDGTHVKIQFKDYKLAS